MSIFGFKVPVHYLSDTYTKGGVAVSLSEVNGERKLLVSTSIPVRQYVEIPWSLIEKAVEDVTGQELQAASARRTKKNGY